MTWLNPPKAWRLDVSRSSLIIEPDGGTDFWQRTHYGFRVDNGHLLSALVPGDFVLETWVTFDPMHQYDQAGLMIRADEWCWGKCSVEHELDQPAQLGTVVTNRGYSDWSMQTFPFGARTIGLRMTRKGQDIVVDFSAPGSNVWSQMRVAHLDHPMELPLHAGLYACSPKGTGFRAEFHEVRIESI